jgi:phage minor structural protein
MEYPVTGIHFDEIESRSIIKARANQFSEPQLFRVYSQKKIMKRNVVLKAEHISYDLTGIAVSPFFASNSFNALDMIKQNSVVDNKFLFYSDFNENGNFRSKAPTSARSVLGELLKTYGGVYEFDNFNVRYLSQRGTNRGVSIRYGKNLTDLKQEENCSAIFTGIYPYWISSDESGTLVELPEKIIHAEGNYSFHRIKSVDFSGAFQNQPTQDKLREAAVKYMEQNHVGVPQVSLTVSFASLEQSAEYKNSGILEKVSIGDTVNVEFPAMGVSADAEAVKLVYNVLLDRVDSVTLGNVKSNIADTIAEQKKELSDTPKKSQLQIAIDVLTKALLGASGGSVRMLDTNEDGLPDTLYIADDPDPIKAKKVWRFNYEGWGASENGYNGPFKMGATLDGGIVADFITAGTLYGLLFKAGMIESLDGKIKVDLSSGGSAVFNSGISCNGINVRADSIGAKSALKVGTTETTAGKQLVSIIGTNELNETFLTLRESFDPEDEKTGGYLGLFGEDENSAIMQSNTYGGSIYLSSKFGGNILLEASSEDSLKSRIVVDVISPGEKSDFAWEYIPSIGKTMLVRV